MSCRHDDAIKVMDVLFLLDETVPARKDPKAVEPSIGRRCIPDHNALSLLTIWNLSGIIMRRDK